MNKIVADAIATLRIEANRLADKELRLPLLKKVDALSRTFQILDEMDMDGMPGKVVVRDDDGNIIGMQG